MTTVLNGVVGGIVAAVATAVAAAPRGAGPSTTATALADRFGGDAGATRFRLGALAAHFGYGALVGGSLVALDRWVFGLLSVTPELGPTMIAAVGWALLFAVLTVGFWLATGVDVDRERVAAVFASHAALGVVLGLWIYGTWIT